MKSLANKHLVDISTRGWIVMHPLVQQLGRHIVLEQSGEPEKRQFIIEAEEIRDVLANETGTGSILGISLDMSKINGCSISGKSFEGMRNLRFLRIYRRKSNKEITIRIVDEMKYLPRLRLLHWEEFPQKRLPSTFRPECLINLHMPGSKLEKLWGGIEPLTSLKEINLSFSHKLKKIPNLSNAPNLEILILRDCTSLVELPSSISNLHKLKTLRMFGCTRLKVLPTNINLASLEIVDMYKCSQLRSFPDISRNIKYLYLGNPKIKEVPPSVVRQWSRLEDFCMDGRNLKRLTYVPLSVVFLDLSFNDMERIPDCVIGLPRLRTLKVQYCRKLVSLPDLSPSLEFLFANDCESLERVCSSFHYPVKVLMFHNCLKLDEEARRKIIQQRVERYVWLPGKEVPVEFTHKAKGNSVTIPLAPGGDQETLALSSRFKACLLLSPTEDFPANDITCHLRIKGGVQINEVRHRVVTQWKSKIQTGHLFIIYDNMFQENICVDGTAGEILFEFRCGDKHKIVECGVQILTNDVESNSSEDEYFDAESSNSSVDFGTRGNNNQNSAGDREAAKVTQNENIKSGKDYWNWFRKLGPKKKKKSIKSQQLSY